MDVKLDDLFTVQSLVTLQGGAAACYLVPNVLGVLIPKLPDLARKWISFVIAMVVAYIAASLIDGNGLKWVVAFFNGFLIAASAFGVNQFTAGDQQRRSLTERRFLVSWR